MFIWFHLKNVFMLASWTNLKLQCLNSTSSDQRIPMTFIHFTHNTPCYTKIKRYWKMTLRSNRIMYWLGVTDISCSLSKHAPHSFDHANYKVKSRTTCLVKAFITFFVTSLHSKYTWFVNTCPDNNTWSRAKLCIWVCFLFTCHTFKPDKLHQWTTQIHVGNFSCNESTESPHHKSISFMSTCSIHLLA